MGGILAEPTSLFQPSLCRPCGPACLWLTHPQGKESKGVAEPHEPKGVFFFETVRLIFSVFFFPPPVWWA